MLFELFVVGTFWFWVLLALALFGVIAAVVNEKFSAATGIAGVFFTLLMFFGSFNLVKYVWLHPVHFITIIGIYLCGGVPWAYAKMRIWGKNIRHDLDDIKAEFLQKKGITEDQLTPQLLDEWNNCYEKRRFCELIGNTDGSVTPKLRNHKATLTAWAAYWPISIVATVWKDAIVEFWNNVTRFMVKKFQTVMDNIFRDADFKIPQTPPVPTPEVSQASA